MLFDMVRYPVMEVKNFSLTLEERDSSSQFILEKSAINLSLSKFE